MFVFTRKESVMVVYDRLLLQGVAALPQSTPEARQAVYQRARSALQNHLRNVQPPLAETVISAQERALEEATARVETQMTKTQATKAPVLSLPVLTPPKDRVSRVGQGGSWLTDLLARASEDDTPDLPPVEQPKLREQQPTVVPFVRPSTTQDVKLVRRASTPRVDSLNQILRKLQSESPGVEASALISEDGLMIASSLTPDMEETRVAGMAATLQNLGGRAAVELARGQVREVIVRGDKGYAVMIRAGQSALLLALADEVGKLGLIFFDMLEAIKALEQVLAGENQSDINPSAGALGAPR